jgi:hypothetical protein
MIGPGERVPAARVWTGAADRKGITLEGLAAAGPFLLLFYLYDWTGT